MNPDLRPLEGSHRTQVVESIRWSILLLLVGALFCAAYNRWTFAAWRTPLAYNDGDALPVLANIKAFASGEIRPVVTKYPLSFGAPFVADWNDYPSPAEGIFVWAALVSRICGLFAGFNATMLSAHLFTAASFYFVARTLHYRAILCLAGAIVFSFSHYAFARSFGHIGPAFYWHIPLGLLVAYLSISDHPAFSDRKRFLFGVAVAVAFGVQDPYYAALFLQLLVVASVVCYARGRSWSTILFPVFIASAVLATCVVMNLDTLFSRATNGRNADALERNYAALELYALKPIELFLPFPHR